MTSSPKKSSGGPRTAKGKQVSSQNALVHGATSNRVTSAVQQSLVEQYEKDLTAYYKPESPLEKMQIQRIALCKAKLDALYELEQVKLQIACEDLERSPELIMQKIDAEDDLVKAIAETIIEKRDLDLPLGLNPHLLQVISSEINVIGGRLEMGDDLNLVLPSLDRFLNESADKLKLTPYEVLLRIGKTINAMFDERGLLDYKLRDVLRSIRQANQEKIDGENSLNLAITASNDEAKHTKTQETLSGIVRMNLVVNNAYELAQKFLRMQDLMLRSVTLSGEESDRLLRYQTTWERRLSSAIGELLALQAKNGK
jgi:hypothetical protein